MKDYKGCTIACGERRDRFEDTILSSRSFTAQIVLKTYLEIIPKRLTRCNQQGSDN